MLDIGDITCEPAPCDAKMLRSRKKGAGISRWKTVSNLIQFQGLQGTHGIESWPSIAASVLNSMYGSFSVSMDGEGRGRCETKM
jgi:hypothetical protein